MMLLGTSVVALAACSDWTDVESVTLNTPSLETQNPQLYEAYIQSLKVFKSTNHLISMATMSNVAEAPSGRSQHLTDMPDSLDYICLANVLEVSEENSQEISKVHKFGTKVLGLIDVDAIEDEFTLKLEAEKAEQTSSEQGKEGDAEGPTEAEQFIEFCKAEVAKQVEACTSLGVDGIVLNYTGYDINSVVTEEDIAAETARQAAFLDGIAAWKSANADKTLVFKGNPQNLITKDILSDCKYIILYAHGVKNAFEMSYLAIMASVDGVPTDRFVLGTTTPYKTNSGSINGELGDGTSAITGAAQWAVEKATGYTKAGISIDDAGADYFNPIKTYRNIREAINIMNPTVN